MNKIDRYSYPCIITYNEDDKIFYVDFPDFDCCFTDGEDLEEALLNARDVLGLVLYEFEEKGLDIPEAAKGFIKTEKNQSISFIDVWMPFVRDKIENKSVKKTLTIPKWLNDIAVERKVNFSQVLQNGLKDYLGINK